MDFFRFGIEREALRITPDGRLSRAPHPPAFGDKLTHPMITTDFAENQLEFITPVASSIDEAITFLHQIMAWTQQHIGEEMLWPLSMPPDMDPDCDIPIAYYGESPERKAKEIYRRGLALRYGKGVQAVSGVHLNVSCTEEALRLFAGERTPDELYMGLVRNFLRFRFLLVYAYGASPVAGAGYPFKEASEECNPTSIRMSRYGYSNVKERGFLVSYNSVKEYVHGLRYGITTPHADYESIGTRRNGEHIQLNTNILQTPAEYYTPVRIKPVINEGDDVLSALETKGVQRVEFRTFDIFPYCATGVERQHLDFFLVFLVFCMRRNSPPLTHGERERVNALQRKVALCGRKGGITIECEGKERPIAEACECICREIREAASLLDDRGGEGRYGESVNAYCDRLKTGKSVSVRMVKDMEKRGLNHQEFGMDLAREHREELMRSGVSEDMQKNSRDSRCIDTLGA